MPMDRAVAASIEARLGCEYFNGSLSLIMTAIGMKFSKCIHFWLGRRLAALPDFAAEDFPWRRIDAKSLTWSGDQGPSVSACVMIVLPLSLNLPGLLNLAVQDLGRCLLRPGHPAAQGCQQARWPIVLASS